MQINDANAVYADRSDSSEGHQEQPSLKNVTKKQYVGKPYLRSQVCPEKWGRTKAESNEIKVKKIIF